jgi:hypothetical protein
MIRLSSPREENQESNSIQKANYWGLIKKATIKFRGGMGVKKSTQVSGLLVSRLPSF